MNRLRQEEGEERHHTVQEVARFLNVSPQTVYHLCHTRRLRHLRLGVGRGAVRIPASALDEFLTQATVRPHEPAAPKPHRAKLKRSPVITTKNLSLS
jgi:excisionase family DNA binding protein